ncbi:MAG: universal stress protein [Cyanobacteria bacterium P01_G01_bin.19]
MFKKIIVALDRSSEASTVFDFALSIAQPGGSELLLLHFIDWQMQDVSPWIGIATLYDVDISGDRYNWTRQRQEREMKISNDWLKSKAQTARKSGISCKYECHIGNCNLGIGDRAKDWGADLIVIGRRGRSNISEMFLGSVSNYTIHHAPCSVMVVQGSKIAGDRSLEQLEINLSS